VDDGEARAPEHPNPATRLGVEAAASKMATALAVDAVEQPKMAMVLAAQRLEAVMEDLAMAKVQATMAGSDVARVAAVPMERSKVSRWVVGRPSCRRIRWGTRQWK
jgi:isopentenyl diphosphate isomerase/L-lactate dehydrogenase-like FMN-dependent dehydrogenase